MPKGPQGQKRPADAIGCAVTVAKIATGELEQELQEPSGRVRSGKVGGQARAKKLTKAQRSAIARKAAQARWKESKLKKQGRWRQKMVDIVSPTSRACGGHDATISCSTVRRSVT